MRGSGHSMWAYPLAGCLVALALLSISVPVLKLVPDHDGAMLPEVLRARARGQCITKPPLTASVCPVTKRDRSDSAQTTWPLTSAGCWARGIARWLT